MDRGRRVLVAVVLVLTLVSLAGAQPSRDGRFSPSPKLPEDIAADIDKDLKEGEGSLWKAHYKAQAWGHHDLVKAGKLAKTAKSVADFYRECELVEAPDGLYYFTSLREIVMEDGNKSGGRKTVWKVTVENPTKRAFRPGEKAFSYHGVIVGSAFCGNPCWKAPAEKPEVEYGSAPAVSKPPKKVARAKKPAARDDDDDSDGYSDEPRGSSETRQTVRVGEQSALPTPFGASGGSAAPSLGNDKIAKLIEKRQARSARSASPEAGKWMKGGGLKMDSQLVQLAQLPIEIEQSVSSDASRGGVNQSSVVITDSFNTVNTTTNNFPGCQEGTHTHNCNHCSATYSSGCPSQGCQDWMHSHDGVCPGRCGGGYTNEGGFVSEFVVPLMGGGMYGNRSNDSRANGGWYGNRGGHRGGRSNFRNGNRGGRGGFFGNRGGRRGGGGGVVRSRPGGWGTNSGGGGTRGGGFGGGGSSRGGGAGRN